MAPANAVEGLGGLALPRQWGDYLLLERLGESLYGETFLARFADAERAQGAERLLLFRRGLERLEGMVALGLEEARVLTRLVHPGICRLLSVEAPGGVAEVVTEHALGLSVAQLGAELERAPGESPPRWRVAVALAIQACEVLEYLHTTSGLEVIASRGSALTAEHLFVDHAGRARFVDVGLGRLLWDLPWQSKEHGFRGGPRLILSPEAVRGLAPVPGSDVFCLGWLLWELITGRRLFVGGSDFEMLQAIVRGVVPPLGSVVPDVPQSLDDAIAGALRTTLEERLSVARFAAAIGHLMQPTESFAVLASAVQAAYRGVARA